MARKYRRATTQSPKQNADSPRSVSAAPPASPKAFSAASTGLVVDKHAYVKSDLRRIGIISGAILVGYAVLYLLNQSLGWI